MCVTRQFLESRKKSRKRFGIAGIKEHRAVAVPSSIISPVTQRHFKQFQQRAAARKLEVTLTFEEFHRLRNGRCHYCGIEPFLVALYCDKFGLKTPYTTIDRKDNRQGYFTNNCVSCCFICNRTKGNFLTEEDMLEIGARFIQPKWDKFRDDVWEEYMGNIESGAYAIDDET